MEHQVVNLVSSRLELADHKLKQNLAMLMKSSGNLAILSHISEILTLDTT